MYDVPAGARVPGSQFYRAYCARCGEAMRVTIDRLDSLSTPKSVLECPECAGYRQAPAKAEFMTPRQRDALRKTN